MLQKVSIRSIGLLALLAIGASVLLFAGTGSALNIDAAWVQTPAAIARTQAGDCPVAGEDCWELCFRGSGSGTFGCYNVPPDPASGNPGPPTHP